MARSTGARALAIDVGFPALSPAHWRWTAVRHRSPTRRLAALQQLGSLLAQTPGPDESSLTARGLLSNSVRHLSDRRSDLLRVRANERGRRHPCISSLPLNFVTPHRRWPTEIERPIISVGQSRSHPGRFDRSWEGRGVLGSRNGCGSGWLLTGTAEWIRIGAPNRWRLL